MMLYATNYRAPVNPSSRVYGRGLVGVIGRASYGVGHVLGALLGALIGKV